ncbi:MAG: hypothetical protein M3N13_03545 [Candidatus Eremiobacteraeota bacterium]|nr:hypothetical protein [Candidatus Eremiobacteraeota bacterium]
MARARALALVAAAAIAPSAQAQSLQHLSVRQFTLSADTAAPKLEVPFHLVLTVRAGERVSSIANLDLPILAELELLGDERRVTSDRSGTTYREIIGVVAHHAGDIHVSPATVDAIDPRDRRGKRYFSNDLTLHVTGAVLAPLTSAGNSARSLLRAVMNAILLVAGIAATVFIVMTLARRRRRQVGVALPLPDPVIEPPERSARDVLHDGLLALRAERTREAAVAVRSLARHIIGASERETLADVLRRPGAYDPRMRDVLRTLERAAFTYDSDVTAAIGAAIHALEHATQ